MYFLYAPKSVSFNRYYIGISENIYNRLAEHNFGEVKSTRAYRPFALVYEEAFADKKSARKQKIFLKITAAARKEIFEKIRLASSSNG